LKDMVRPVKDYERVSGYVRLHVAYVSFTIVV
jgi:hypothetical protein